MNGGAGGYEVGGYRSPEVLGIGEARWVFSYVATEVVVDPAP